VTTTTDDSTLPFEFTTKREVDRVEVNTEKSQVVFSGHRESQIRSDLRI
jgi:hypothetical protein